MATKTPYQAVMEEAMHNHDFSPFTVTLDRNMVEVTMDNEGNPVLTFVNAKLDYCPDVLAAGVNNWCERNKINSEILVDAMLKAATQEAAVSNLRQCLVLRP